MKTNDKSINNDLEFNAENMRKKTHEKCDIIYLTHLSSIKKNIANAANYGNFSVLHVFDNVSKQVVDMVIDELRTLGFRCGKADGRNDCAYKIFWN